jgi:hypothetical protein
MTSSWDFALDYYGQVFRQICRNDLFQSFSSCSPTFKSGEKHVQGQEF